MGLRASMAATVAMLYTLATIVLLAVYSWDQLAINAYALLVLTGMGAFLNLVWWSELERAKNRIDPHVYSYARLAIILSLFYVIAFVTHGFLHFYDPDEVAIQTALSLSLCACPVIYSVLLYNIFRRYME